MRQNPPSHKTSAARRDEAIAWATETLGHRFDDPALLLQALTHKSAGKPNYERLEFLGDRVLGLTMASWLYRHFPNDAEGKLNTRFARLVSGATCAAIARAIGVDRQLILGVQAVDDGGADSDNILGDVMEALIGAVWLEGGADVARALIQRLWSDATSAAARAVKHPKSAVQEWAAARNHPAPLYRLLDRSGPEHQPVFRIALTVGAFLPVEAEGHSKQDAETQAARLFLEQHQQGKNP